MISAINGILVDEANRLGGDFYTRQIATSPWIDLLTPGEWTEEMGEAVSMLVWERTLPSSALTWNKFSGQDATPGGGAQNSSILPPVQTISTAKTLREYNLEHTALQSEKLNTNDLKTSVMVDEQLGAIRDNLNQNTQWLWMNRNRSEYIRLSKNHIILNSEGNYEGTSIPATAAIEANIPVSNKALQRYRQRLILAGAGKNPMLKIDGAPVFGLSCDSEISDALQNEQDSNLRYAGKADALLAPLGIEKVVKNFLHIIDDTMSRFTWDHTTGAYTEVLPYTTGAATFGTKLVENTAWETAPYTDIVIFHYDTMQPLFPNPKTSGTGVTFDPVQYRGDWKWMNVVNVDESSSAYNPDGTIGFFRGVFANGSKPKMVEFGYRIRVLRPGFSPYVAG